MKKQYSKGPSLATQNLEIQVLQLNKPLNAQNVEYINTTNNQDYLRRNSRNKTQNQNKNNLQKQIPKNQQYNNIKSKLNTNLQYNTTNSTSNINNKNLEQSIKQALNNSNNIQVESVNDYIAKQAPKNFTIRRTTPLNIDRQNYQSNNSNPGSHLYQTENNQSPISKQNNSLLRNNHGSAKNIKNKDLNPKLPPFGFGLNNNNFSRENSKNKHQTLLNNSKNAINHNIRTGLGAAGLNVLRKQQENFKGGMNVQKLQNLKKGSIKPTQNNPWDDQNLNIQKQQGLPPTNTKIIRKKSLSKMKSSNQLNEELQLQKSHSQVNNSDQQYRNSEQLISAGYLNLTSPIKQQQYSQESENNNNKEDNLDDTRVNRNPKQFRIQSGKSNYNNTTINTSVQDGKLMNQDNSMAKEMRLNKEDLKTKQQELDEILAEQKKSEQRQKDLEDQIQQELLLAKLQQDEYCGENSEGKDESYYGDENDDNDFDFEDQNQEQLQKEENQEKQQEDKEIQEKQQQLEKENIQQNISEIKQQQNQELDNHSYSENEFLQQEDDDSQDQNNQIQNNNNNQQKEISNTQQQYQNQQEQQFTTQFSQNMYKHEIGKIQDQQFLQQQQQNQQYEQFQRFEDQINNDQRIQLEQQLQYQQQQNEQPKKFEYQKRKLQPFQGINLNKKIQKNEQQQQKLEEKKQLLQKKNSKKPIKVNKNQDIQCIERNYIEHMQTDEIYETVNLKNSRLEGYQNSNSNDFNYNNHVNDDQNDMALSGTWTSFDVGKYLKYQEKEEKNLQNKQEEKQVQSEKQLSEDKNPENNNEQQEDINSTTDQSLQQNKINNNLQIQQQLDEE